MAHIIACRLASYGDYQDKAWSHLPEIGIRNVELPVPPPADVDDVKKKIADHGLTATSLQSRVDITQADAVDVMKPQLATCADFGAKICFVSIKAGDADRNAVWDRLRRIGDAAADAGVIVGMETHPDLVTNGDLGRETMAAINHPNVKINFDTGNIYFYNENRTAVDELKKVIQDVAAVHLKDSGGVYQEWNFPTLGTGAVDFPGVFAVLDEVHFAGPCTMELEGTKGVDRSESEHLQYIADSVNYLRQIGLLT